MHIVPGKYRIKNAKAWTTFDEATDDSHVIHGWQQTNQPNQHWLVQAKGPDCFTMKNLASKLYAYADRNPHNGTALHGNSRFTIWCLDQQPDGSVYITLNETNLVADLDNGNPANGTTIHLWEKHPNPERQQLWYFERID